MLVFLLITLIVILLLALAVTCFYLIRFARIIFSIEDQLENTLETLSTVSTSLEDLLKMKLFFDSKEVKYAVEEALSGVKLSKVAVIQLINDFTRLSKEKYITVRSDEEEEDSEEQIQTRRQAERIAQIES
jgi:hypothetical protein